MKADSPFTPTTQNPPGNSDTRIPLATRAGPPATALVWMTGPNRKSAAPADLRSVALSRGALPGLLKPAPSGGGEGWREATLLEGWRVTPQVLGQTLDTLGSMGDGRVLRLEWPFSGEGISALLNLEIDPGDGRPPPFVHFQLHRLALPGEAAQEELARLAGRGWPLCAEILLEKGVNDQPRELQQMLTGLQQHRVRPYFLVDGEWLPPERRITRPDALELVRSLRGWISGLAVPQLVVEDLTGIRSPLIPEYLRKVDQQGVEGHDYRGNSFSYSHKNRPHGEEG